MRAAVVAALVAVGLLTAAPAASAHPYWECRLWHGTIECDADAALHRAAERSQGPTEPEEQGDDCRTSWADRRDDCGSQACLEKTGRYR